MESMHLSSFQIKCQKLAASLLAITIEGLNTLLQFKLCSKINQNDNSFHFFNSRTAIFFSGLSLPILKYWFNFFARTILLNNSLNVHFPSNMLFVCCLIQHLFYQFMTLFTYFVSSSFFLKQFETYLHHYHQCVQYV